MCISVHYAPRDEITDPWDRTTNRITIPAPLAATALFTLRAIRAVLTELGVDQGPNGARCWCGEDITLPHNDQQRHNEVIHLDA